MPCIRVCQFNRTTCLPPNVCVPANDYNGMVHLRKWWEIWDLRILSLYILIAQLYLHFFGRLRRRNKSPLMMNVSVWFLYLFSDLLSTIALGKLSKLKVDKDDGKDALRVMWAPLILFYLGGPDTITVLRVEENQLWVRHLIGLFTLGLRAAYALIVTWNRKDPELSLLALFVFIPGIIKYGERVWVVKSRSKGEGFVLLDSPTNDKTLRPIPEHKMLAYSCLQTLRPHCKDVSCDPREMKNVLVGSSTADAFKLIEIELGLISDMLFSKVGTIFTQLGSVLRSLSFSLIVSALVIYVACKKPHEHSEGDHIVTIMLLAGAIFLEIAGIIVQLRSDWAMVWACKNRSEWGTLVLVVHKFLISKCPSQRWSGVMGQLSLPEPTVCNKTWEFEFGREKMLKSLISLHQSLGKPESPVQHAKNLIMEHLREKCKVVQTSTTTDADVDTPQTSSEKVPDVDKLPTSGVERGKGTLERYDLERKFEWSIDREFGQSIIILHIATALCYKKDTPKDPHRKEVKLEAVKILSNYMMYLLVECPSEFPFCKKYEEIVQDFNNKKDLSIRGKSKEVENEGNTTVITLVNKMETLVNKMETKEKRWEIIGSMWAEMICYAAWKCPVENHIQELRHGGEFLTHVWLLLMHFGIRKNLEGSNPNQKEEGDSSVKNTVSTFNDLFAGGG